MMRKNSAQIVLWLGCIASLLAVPAPSASAVGNRQSDSEGLTAAIDKIAGEALEKLHLPGLSIAVGKDGETIVAKGYGLAEVENDVAATAQTVYRIGSITKQFTAAAVMQLVEQEKLSLDGELNEFLPDYPAGDHKVTVRHLLNHTSGIKSYTSIPSYRQNMRNDLSHEETLAAFQDKPFDFEPGERFAYSNSGYYLLGLIIEKASGQSYEQYLKEHIFTPLELNATFYDRTERVIPNRARGYARKDEELFNAPYLSMNLPFSAGALASTVEDLLRWQQALFAGRVVSRESLKQMTTPGELNDGKSLRYGFGLFIGERNGVRLISHGGGINGFRSHLAHYPELDLTIAVLTNLSSGQPEGVERRIANLFLGDAQARDFDLLIRRGTVVDGTGKPPVEADVGIRNGRIVHVGPAQNATAEVEIDADVLVVAPGNDSRLLNLVRAPFDGREGARRAGRRRSGANRRHANRRSTGPIFAAVAVKLGLSRVASLDPAPHAGAITHGMGDVCAVCELVHRLSDWHLPELDGVACPFLR